MSKSTEPVMYKAVAYHWMGTEKGPILFDVDRMNVHDGMDIDPDILDAAQTPASLEDLSKNTAWAERTATLIEWGMLILDTQTAKKSAAGSAYQLCHLHGQCQPKMQSHLPLLLCQQGSF